MTARTEYEHEGHSTSGKTIALTLLLALVVLAGITGFVGALKPDPMLWGWQRLAIAAASLLISACALWRFSRLEPSGVKGATLMLVLASTTMMGFAGIMRVVSTLIATDQLWKPWAGQNALILAKNLLLLLIGIVGFLWLKPWRASHGSDEPLSPTTRKTNMLFALSGLIAVPGMLVLVYATRQPDNQFGLLSNSAVSPGVTSFVIVSWMLGMAISWWWYFSADEHERHAYDFGTLVAGGMFLTVTPVWWIAARADFVPQPNAMVLWVITLGVSTIGWAWRRSR